MPAILSSIARSTIAAAAVALAAGCGLSADDVARDTVDLRTDGAQPEFETWVPGAESANDDERPWWEVPAGTEVPDVPVSDTEWRVLDSHLSGILGSVSANDTATMMDVWADPTMLTINSYVDGSAGGIMMTGLNIFGGLDTLEPGVTHVFSLYDDFSWPHVDILGCAGEDLSFWEFDEFAPETEVTVEEDQDDPDVLWVKYTSTWFASDGGRDAVVHGRLQLTRR